MRLKKVVAIINQMQSDGVIGRYAIGGAVGATFYLEPVRTLDIDVFVAIHEEIGKFVSLDPIFDYLTNLGCKMEREYVVIERSLVQFLSAGPLVEEAIVQANEIQLEGERTFVFSAEHLAAIALQTNRPKDKARLLQFIDADVLDENRFDDILKRHNLTKQWRNFRQTFLGSK